MRQFDPCPCGKGSKGWRWLYPKLRLARSDALSLTNIGGASGGDASPNGDDASPNGGDASPNDGGASPSDGRVPSALLRA
jgi:hypothetical protein